MAPIFEGTGEQMTVAKLSFYTGVCFRRSLAKLFRWYSLVAQRVKHLPAMRETQVRSLGQEDPLEKKIATQSGTLSWKIPRTEKPGRLLSM